MSESSFLHHNQHLSKTELSVLLTIQLSKQKNHRAPEIIMKFFAILSILSIGALAAAIAEPEAYADADAAPDALLEKRFDCNRRVALCASGTFIGKDSCQCSGQVGRCDLWACPAGRRVSAHSKGLLLSPELPMLFATASDLFWEFSEPGVADSSWQQICGQRGSGCVYV